MHPVLSFVEHSGARAAEDLIGHFHLGDAESLGNLGPDGRLSVMERRKAMHEDASWSHKVDHAAVDLVWGKKLNSFFPQFRRLAHGNPNVGVNDVGARACLLNT